MGKIIRNGIEYCGTSDTADNIIYDNKDSGLAATNTQAALDELTNNLGGLKFGTDGDGNFGYYGADGSLIPFNSDRAIFEADVIIKEAQSTYISNNTTSATYNIPSDSQYSYYVVSISVDPAGHYLSNLDINCDYLIKDLIKNSLNGGVGGYILFKADSSKTVTITATHSNGSPNNAFCYSIIGIKAGKETENIGEIEIIPLVPTLTSNTGSDGGEASASSKYSNDYDAWRAFDGLPGGNDWLTVAGQSDAWIKYKFTVPTIVTKVSYIMEGNFVYDVILQGSNDDNSWENIGTTITVSMSPSKETHEFSVKNNTAYMYYRLYCTNSTNNGYYGLYELQFYGYQFKELIPTMTSNTTPEGEASASSNNANDSAFYYAFDNNINTRWVTKSGVGTNSYIQYKFNKPTSASFIKILPYYGTEARVKDFVLQASENGTSFIDLYSGTCENANKSNYFTIANTNQYMYYRLLIKNTYSASSTDIISVVEMQLYAKPEGVNVSSGIDIKDTLVFKGISLPISIQGSTYTNVAEVLYNVQGYNKLSTAYNYNNCSGKISVHGMKPNADGSYSYRDETTTLATSGTDLVLTDVDISEYDVVYIRNWGGNGTSLALVRFDMTLSK